MIKGDLLQSIAGWRVGMPSKSFSTYHFRFSRSGIQQNYRVVYCWEW